MRQGQKFLKPPKHPLSTISQKAVVQKLNALLNGQILDPTGKIIGYIHYGDGNTIFEIQAQGGIPWQKPYRELDPTVAVAAGTWVYVSPENPIATTGLNDLVANVTITTPPGIWEAAQNVPAKVTGGYNVPQPLARSTPSGTPLKGDMDATVLFWRPIAPAMICT